MKSYIEEISCDVKNNKNITCYNIDENKNKINERSLNLEELKSLRNNPSYKVNLGFMDKYNMKFRDGKLTNDELMKAKKGFYLMLKIFYVLTILSITIFIPIILFTDIKLIFKIVLGGIILLCVLEIFVYKRAIKKNKSQLRKRLETYEKCDGKIFTPASIGHFFGHTLITIICVFLIIENVEFKISFILSFIISMILGIIWEFYEFSLSDTYYTFACESIYNKITDLILAFFGSLLAYPLLLFIQ